MMKKTMDMFYFSEDENIHLLSEVQEEYKKNNGDISKYNGNMYCPECYHAELSFTHKTSRSSEYFSKLPSSNHLNGCSYNYPYGSKKIITEYCNHLTEQQIGDKLEAALNILMRKHIDRNNHKNIPEKDNPFIAIKKEHNNTYRRYAIPRKSLNCWLDKDLGTDPYIFYGNVKLKVKTIETKDKEEVNYLQIYTRNRDGEWKFKSSITRWGYKDNIDENQVYDIAVLGCLNFEGRFMRIFAIKNGVKYRIRLNE